MLKKHEKIIRGVINPTHEQTKKAQFSSDTGFYYIIDGYRCVRFAEHINDLPLFEYGENKYNCPKQYERANEVDYDALEIPYTTEQIKSWMKETKKTHRGLKFPFKLGRTVDRLWIGINPKFLIDAMETTRSNILFVPHEGKVLLIKGNGFVWLIMPILLQGFENDKHMTTIGDIL